jgi:hypothetical protein
MYTAQARTQVKVLTLRADVLHAVLPAFVVRRIRTAATKRHVTAAHHLHHFLRTRLPALLPQLSSIFRFSPSATSPARSEWASSTAAV